MDSGARDVRDIPRRSRPAREHHIAGSTMLSRWRAPARSPESGLGTPNLVAVPTVVGPRERHADRLALPSLNAAMGDNSRQSRFWELARFCSTARSLWHRG